MVACVLEPRGLTRAEARLTASYQPGDIVAFRKSEKGRPRAGIGYRVEAVDAERGTVRLVPDKGKAHDWQPARWGSAQAEAFVEVEQEFRAGDRIQFTRNNYRAERHNGDTAEVVAIDPQGASMVVEREDGRRDMLDLAHLADRHVRPGWVRTIHSPQGRRAIGSWPIWRASAPTPSTPPPSMSRSAGPGPARSSTPTAAPASPRRSDCVKAARSAQSMK